MAPKALVLLVAIIVLSGCTVTPSVAPVATASFSGNTANGGVIDLGPGSQGPAHVTLGWVMAYNALCDKYGAALIPPVRQGEGLQPLPDGTFTVDFEHLADKNVMATLARSGIAP